MNRRLVPELMDNPNLDPVAHRQALAGLARLNSVSDAGRILLPYLRRLSETHRRPLRILDVATGAGDGLLPLLRRSKLWRFPLVGAGCDLSETALDEARQRAVASGVQAEFFAHDALKSALPMGYDVIMNSLFFHHLTDADISRRLQDVGRAAAVGILVNDLRRSRWNRMQVWVATRLLSRSPVVHFDGPVSVQAALTPAELSRHAAKAGLCNAVVRTHFPCRMVLAWTKS